MENDSISQHRKNIGRTSDSVGDFHMQDSGYKSSCFHGYKSALIRAAVITDILGIGTVKHRFGLSTSKLLFKNMSGPAGNSGYGK